MTKLYFGLSDSRDGWMNLSQDEYLLDALPEDAIALFLYINNNAVIIGRNQNPWTQCNLSQMQSDSVQLVRRISGGGAVYHDKGNLNFSFICSQQHADMQKQTDIVLRALHTLGIRAEQNGRNDLTVYGKKISGTASAERRNNRLFHGTLLVDTDFSAMQKYLNVSAAKLQAKGVQSVRARVGNLREFVPEITVDQLVEALQSVFCATVGTPQAVHELFRTEDAQREIAALYQRHQSWRWRLGEAPKFDYKMEDRFSCGMMELCLTVTGGQVEQAVVYTDALDTQLPNRIEKVLLGLPFDLSVLAHALCTLGDMGREIADKLLAGGLR